MKKYYCDICGAEFDTFEQGEKHFRKYHLRPHGETVHHLMSKKELLQREKIRKERMRSVS